MVMKATASRHCLFLSALLLIGCQTSPERNAMEGDPPGGRQLDPGVRQRHPRPFEIARESGGAGRANLSPTTLKQIVAVTCGDAPTGLVISACHSGTFIRERTIGPAVIILVAANEARKSFGCRAERRYTYYDGCFLTEFPNARTWQDLHARMLTCVHTKGAGLRDLPSEPQAFFGTRMKDLPLPGAR